MGYIRKGTVDYLQEKGMDPNTPVNMPDYIIPLTSPVYMEAGMGNLYLVSGGKLNDEFLLKLARIDSQELVGENLKKNLVQLLKDCCEALKDSGGIDYILIDSRAGWSGYGTDPSWHSAFWKRQFPVVVWNSADGTNHCNKSG